MRIGIVGPCGAGKSTLARSLAALGYDAHDIAQEHSQVPYMWQKITAPDVLVYLDASLPEICTRLQVRWEESYIAEQKRRLEHASRHLDLYVDTDTLSTGQVLERCLDFLSTSFPPQA